MDIKFYYRLSDAIRESGKTIRQLSEDVGCHENTLFRFVNAYGNINLNLFKKLCEVLNISADWLLFGKEEKR